ncbi:MAG TPA: ATP-binding cassette domain-containing protein [Candidatus Dormibacteraeota bacterium]|nr:ATP-binding cassette domain-containing protein [Candidatus Dormibacteraeota bacterium]
MTVIECRSLVHIYKAADLEVFALQGLDMTIEEGEVVAIVGASGSGKTTLMNVLAAVEKPSAGQALVEGIELGSLTDRARDTYRRDVIGYVWQNATLNLTPELTASENLQLPQLLAGRPRKERLDRATELLDTLGLSHRRDHVPAQLSGGEQQRLALGVAVANRPKVLLADEPTAELDRASARRMLEDLGKLRDRDGTTVVMVTHDHEVERHVDRVLRIRDGRTSTETRAETGELLIVDPAGRLQLPKSVRQEAGLGARVRVRVDGGRVIIERADDG